MTPYKDESLLHALEELDVIEKSQLAAAVTESKNAAKPLGEVLIEKDLISDANLGQVISELVGAPLVRLSEIAIPIDVLNYIPEIVARKQQAISFAHDASGVKVAMADPTNTEFLSFLKKKTGEQVKVYLATPKDIDWALGLYKRDLQKTFDESFTEKITQATKQGIGEVPAKEIVDLLIEYAQANGASDIHIEPHKEQSVVRFRIDGVMHDVLRLPIALHNQVVTRIKVAAKLRTDEHLSAQDGKMQVELSTEELDIRVSIVPVIYGEKVVTRLLSSRSRQFGLTDLGMSEGDLAKVRKGFLKPYGMVLSTGPTGSGKTTSIYSILKILNTKEVNIATIEDPVEYDIEGVNQIQVNPKTNLTFSSGLRAILRQDPNIIFVGEIRDEETADIAVNSAMTGHLVLSTLHTNDAATSLPRLMDMGIEQFLVASTINVIIGQRLVRRICLKCRVSIDVPVASISENLPRDLVFKYFKGKKSIRIYKGKGCPVCHSTGHTGRIGIFEVLVLTSEIRELIMAKADADRIKQQAIKDGMMTMLEDGIRKVQKGVTTIEEILRATKE